MTQKQFQGLDLILFKLCKNVFLLKGFGLPCTQTLKIKVLAESRDDWKM